MAGFTLKSYEFRREREAGWRELEELVHRAESGGLSALDADELHRLPILYRGALSSLSVARAISLDRNLLDYLESLAARAYVCVYGAKRNYLEAVGRFFTHTFPRLVWETRWAVALSLALLGLGVACGLVLTLRHPDLYFGFMPEGLAQGRSPLSSREELREVLKSETRSGLTVFASALFTHNAQVGFLCFGLGVAAGVPVALLLFYNGVLLGTLAAVHHRVGLGLEVWARLATVVWVLAMVLLPLFNRQRARLGDLLAGTVVVYEPKAKLDQDMAEEGGALGASEEHRFTPEQLDVYGIRELQVLEDLLRRPPSPDRDEAMILVTEKIQRKIGWQSPAGGVQPRRFLQAFYAAQRARLEKKMLFGDRREHKVR